MMTREYKRVLVIGAGGVGFYLNLSLNRSLPHGVSLEVWDADDFNGGLGHARLPRVSNPATRKVDLLKRFTSVVMGDRPIVVHDALFTGEESESTDLVVDCSDMALGTLGDAASRRSIWARVQQSGSRIIRVSYDGLNETIVVAEGLPLISGSKSGHYQNIPSMALSFAAGGIGAMAVLRVLAGWEQHVEFQIQLSDHFKAPEAVVEVKDDPKPVHHRKTAPMAI